MNTSSSQQRPAPDYWQTSRPRLDLSRLRQVSLKAYAIRFLLGGVVSLLATLAGHFVTHRFGGVFTAFPAILLASLTLIGQKEGREPSAEDAEGGSVGAIAFVASATLLATTLTILIGAASILAALIVWFILAIALYLLCVRLGWLRTYPDQPPESAPPQKNS